MSKNDQINKYEQIIENTINDKHFVFLIITMFISTFIGVIETIVTNEASGQGINIGSLVLLLLFLYIHISKVKHNKLNSAIFKGLKLFFNVAFIIALFISSVIILLAILFLFKDYKVALIFSFLLIIMLYMSMSFYYMMKSSNELIKYVKGCDGKSIYFKKLAHHLILEACVTIILVLVLLFFEQTVIQNANYTVSKLFELIEKAPFEINFVYKDFLISSAFNVLSLFFLGFVLTKLHNNLKHQEK